MPGGMSACCEVILGAGWVQRRHSCGSTEHAHAPGMVRTIAKFLMILMQPQLVLQQIVKVHGEECLLLLDSSRYHVAAC